MTLTTEEHAILAPLFAEREAARKLVDVLDRAILAGAMLATGLRGDVSIQSDGRGGIVIIGEAQDAPPTGDVK